MCYLDYSFVFIFQTHCFYPICKRKTHNEGLMLLTVVNRSNQKSSFFESRVSRVILWVSGDCSVFTNEWPKNDPYVHTAQRQWSPLYRDWGYDVDPFQLNQKECCNALVPEVSVARVISFQMQLLCSRANHFTYLRTYFESIK